MFSINVIRRVIAPTDMQYQNVDDNVLERMVLVLVLTFTTKLRDVILFPLDKETEERYLPRNEEEINLPSIYFYILDEKHIILVQKKIIEIDKYHVVHSRHRHWTTHLLHKYVLPNVINKL